MPAATIDAPTVAPDDLSSLPQVVFDEEWEEAVPCWRWEGKPIPQCQVPAEFVCIMVPGCEHIPAHWHFCPEHKDEIVALLAQTTEIKCRPCGAPVVYLRTVAI